MDRFVVPPRDDAKRRQECSPKSVGDGGSLSAMRAWGGSVSLGMEAITTDTVGGEAPAKDG